MIGENSKIKVHIFSPVGREIVTRNYDRVFNVYKKDGQLGIDWVEFTPLESFSVGNGSVLFEEVDT